MRPSEKGFDPGLSYCRKCGEVWSLCEHGYVHKDLSIDAAHAIRIRARYGLGKLFNPNHDIANYTDAAS